MQRTLLNLKETVMSVLYVIVGLIILATAVFVCSGVGMLTKHLLGKSEYDYYYDEPPSFLLGFFVIVLLSIAMGLVIALSHLLGKSIVNALA